VAPADVPGPASARPRRVLVVEDNADARNMLVFLLKRHGHDVRAASDGPAAIAEAHSFGPEAVLLDVGLPGLDGYAVARELRAAPLTAEVLLVALTGYGQEEDAYAVASALANDRDPPSGGSELDGVCEQVEQDLLQTVWIGRDSGVTAASLGRQAETRIRAKITFRQVRIDAARTPPARLRKMNAERLVHEVERALLRNEP
jgi:CheY-like chemotaxis protein